MAAYTKQHGISLRPHVKTHKSSFVARQQVASGAAGLACATPREVEVMSSVTNNILLAHPLLGSKLGRLENLDSSVRLSLMLDSREAIDQLGTYAQRLNRQIGVLI